MLLNFLLNNWSGILTIAIVIIAIAYLLFLKKYSVLKQMILDLVREAEEEFGSGTGKLKRAYVINALYGLIPSCVKMFLTIGMIDKLIDEALITLNDFIDDGKLNGSCKDVILPPVAGETNVKTSDHLATPVNITSGTTSPIDPKSN